MVIIDSHLHVWSDDEARYPFATRLRRPGSVELLLDEMERAGVDKAVIVQPINYLYDNRYVADCLRRFPGKFAAVGLIDYKAPDAPDRLERLVREDGFGGIRFHLSREPDPAVLAAPERDPLWERARQLGACFIVLGTAERLPFLEPIIDRFPDVPVVIDHFGHVPVDEEPPRPLLGNLLRLARYPNVYVKVSNMNGMSKEPYPHRDAARIFRLVYDQFGPQRLMWGTDFPYVLDSCGYGPALALVRDHADFLTDEDKAWILGRTAAKVWKLYID